MRRGSNFLVIFFMTLLLCLSCFAEDGEEVQTKSKFDSLQKSLLIPGWGQIVEKRYAEGLFFLSTEIFCFYKILSYNHKGNHYYDLYKKADNIGDAINYRELTEKYDIKRNTFFLAAAGVWVINLIDMYLIVKHKRKNQRNPQLKFGLNGYKELAFTVSYSF